MDDDVESAMEAEDVFPCKGCGEILEEGKAFELAGNRWHLDCFRCNTCNTLLDSDANLLLLGDGSLICNNCTYSCSACGNKIEDLAILTGDQAYCATCFRCRNCKRKIENLRYARTSQGIFCMNCHESLMARRRKKSKTAAQARAREKDTSPMITDKSLPALPPNAIPPNAFSNDQVSPESETPTELSPRPRPSYNRQDSSSRSSARSPERAAEQGREPAFAPSVASYRKNRHSTIVSQDYNSDSAGEFFIPVALDPSPLPATNPRSTTEDGGRKGREKDFFATTKSSAGRNDLQTSTPHIAFQEKGRQASSDYEQLPDEEPSRKPTAKNQSRTSPPSNDERKVSTSNLQSSTDDFKLQEAPRSKRLVDSRSSGATPTGSPIDAPSSGKSASTRSKDTSNHSRTDSPSFLNAVDRAASPRSSQDSRSRLEEEIRPSLDSFNSGRSEMSGPKQIARKDFPASDTSRNVNGKQTTVFGGDSSHTLPRLPAMETKLTDTYMQPRAPPQPPVQAARDAAGSLASNGIVTAPKLSPKLPRWNNTGDFSMDEDMARILGTDEGSSALLRRVSNAVRHGRNNSIETSTPHGRITHSRSVSETTRGGISPRWSETPLEDAVLGGHNHAISSPLSLAGAAPDEPTFLRRQLRNSEQRVAELERQFGTEKDLKNLNQRLMEKRKTVSVLDTQAEIMIRQLEVLAGYVERAKDSKEPFDARQLEDSAIKDFVHRMEELKQTMAVQIEKLHSEREALMDERNQALADRNRAMLEFEQLSSKNAQLADMNNDLTHQIQERFKQQISTADVKSPNGLGIYGHSKGASSVYLDSMSVQTGTTMANTEVEESVVEGPTVVNLRKGGQVKKFNWKKGTSKVAHNFSKGINRAAGAFAVQDLTRAQTQQGLTGDNIGLPYNMTMANAEAPVTDRTLNPQIRLPLNSATSNGETQRQAFGFFSKKGAPTTMVKSVSTAHVNMPAAAEAPSTLFGSELVDRADYERRQIPSVVTRCIEEVELRGMDVEGIYRKTGGTSQVKFIQEGFDKSEDFDISDPSLDITAVTSVLKQYFRKLPTPLLAFEVYERILESNSVQEHSERCSHLKQTVNMLPAKHRDCLEFLMFHLVRVAARERENLMSPKNLAVVFAPTIMRDHSLEKEMTDMHAKNVAVQFIIENSQDIFSQP